MFHFEGFITTVICFLPLLLVLFPSLTSNTHPLAFLFEDNPSLPLPPWVTFGVYWYPSPRTAGTSICYLLLLISRSRKNTSVFSWGWATVPEAGILVGSDHLFLLIPLDTQDTGKVWLAYVLSILDVDKTEINTVPSKK